LATLETKKLGPEGANCPKVGCGTAAELCSAGVRQLALLRHAYNLKKACLSSLCLLKRSFSKQRLCLKRRGAPFGNPKLNQSFCASQKAKPCKANRLSQNRLDKV
jgi:hypothetical protein